MIGGGNEQRLVNPGPTTDRGMLPNSKLLVRAGAAVVGLVIAVFGVQRGKIGETVIGLGVFVLGVAELWHYRDEFLPGSTGKD